MSHTVFLSITFFFFAKVVKLVLEFTSQLDFFVVAKLESLTDFSYYVCVYDIKQYIPIEKLLNVEQYKKVTYNTLTNR